MARFETGRRRDIVFQARRRIIQAHANLQSLVRSSHSPISFSNIMSASASKAAPASFGSSLAATAARPRG